MEKKIFGGKIFTLTTEDISPELQYERVYQRNGVTVFPVTNKGNVLFVETNKEPRIRPMSGYIEDGEDPLDCAKRELGEELGLIAKIWIPLTTMTGDGGIKKTQHFFVAKLLDPIEGAHPQDPDEKIFGAVEITPEEIKSRALAGKFNAMPDIALALLIFISSETQE